MEWLHTLLWAVGVVAVFSLLGAAYVYDVLGNTTGAGLLALLGVALGIQAFRIRGWLRKLEKARSE